MYPETVRAMIEVQNHQLRMLRADTEPDCFRVQFNPVELIEDWASLDQEHVEALITGGCISREEAYMRWALRLREYVDTRLARKV